MKRPGVVVGYTAIVIVNLLFSLGELYSLFTKISTVGGFGVLFKLQPLLAAIVVLGVIVIIPTIVMVYQFFMLQKSVLIWVYITFGLSIITQLLSKSYIWAILLVVIGWALVDYVKNKKIEEQPVFT